MNPFFRFPSTPYLVAPAGVSVRSDKVLSASECEAFLSHPVLVEEKIDGQNLGISANDNGLLFQARGSYVEPGVRHFRGLAQWVRYRENRLQAALGNNLILFGEWCAIVHTVRYDRLPDWFLVFDIYDRSRSEFWSAEERDEFARHLDLSVVPSFGVHKLDDDALHRLMGPSRLGSESMEGLVLRSTNGQCEVPRAKAVRFDFIQEIDRHWMSGPQSRNRLSSD